MNKASKAIQRLSISQRDLVDKLPKPRTAKVVELHRGDPSFDTPEYIVQAAVEAMKEGYTHYPPLRGDGQLREAVAEYQGRISGVSISPSEVLPLSGGSGGIFASMAALIDEGDEVIILDPCYSLYADAARVIGARPVFVPLDKSFRVDLDAVRGAITQKTRMLVLNYPSNPTGQLLLKEELDGLAEIAVEHDLAVLSDEVYDQLVFKGEHYSVLGHPALTDRTVLVNSFSKTYAMTGWRVGWVVAKGGVISSVLTINRSTQGHVNIIAQRAGIAALTNREEDQKWRAWALAQYKSRRKTMLEEFAGVPGIHVYEPEAAFYGWVRYEAPLTAAEMAMYLYERGLNVRPGTEFGAQGEKHLRFTFAPSEDRIREGIAIFKAAMEELLAGSD